MPTARQVEWIRKHGDVVQSMVLDVGSRVPGDSKKIERFTVRDALKRNDPVVAYTIVGVDMIDGPNVDVVLDLASSIKSKPILARAFGLASNDKLEFRTIYCLSVMEHVRDPFTFAKNVTKLLAPGGHLFVSVPFIFRYHAHPDDYWRYTPQALELLYPELVVLEPLGEIWLGDDERIVPDIMATRPYADRSRRTMEPVTVNMVFRKPE